MDFEIEDDTAVECLRTALYLTGVVAVAGLCAAWMLGFAVVRFIRGEW